jgi:hypothetical protein
VLNGSAGERLTFERKGFLMSSGQTPPPARPLFRKLAAGVAFICFVLAAVFGLARPEDGLLTPGICLFVGFVMAVIAVTGYWPPRRKE